MKATLLIFTAVALAGCVSTPLFDPSNNDHVVIEKEIRRLLKKPEGELTKGDLGKVKKISLQSRLMAGDLRPLAGLRQLTYLELYNNGKITDLKPLAKLKHLKLLSLANNNVTDLKPLAGLKQLTFLNLDGNKITNIRHLSGLTNMESLAFAHNHLTDQQLVHLSGLKQLKHLRLIYNPKLTKAEITKLKKALPNCRIESNPTK